MRRWNGWGEEQIDYPLPGPAVSFLAERLGEGDTSLDASLDEVLATVPASALPDLPLVNKAPFERLLHSRGQSLPDWIALKTGRVGRYPDGVAFPSSDEDLQQLMQYARDIGATLIAYGGGTSVVGHINPGRYPNPVLSVDFSRLNQLLSIDQTSLLATIQAGACGPDIESQLGKHGFCLGHYPQSFEQSTLGGWIATRSTGQQSYHYGRIEAMFAGGHVETPAGPIDLPALPASAAGPDLRQLILGSEGRFGFITRAEVRIRPLPQSETFYGAFFHTWQEGLAATRRIAQERIPISMARLSDDQETETTMILAGKTRQITWAKRGLKLAGYGPGRCLLIYGITGDQETCADASDRTVEVIRQNRGLFTGQTAGKAWSKTRFTGPYLRNSLWSAGYAIDTLESALPWGNILTAAQAITQAIRESQAAAGERVLVLCHLSHIYTDGASLYLTYLFPRKPDPENTLELWRGMKAAASQAILRYGGTISHQHGVGSDHRPYLEAEKGKLGIQLLETMCRTFDPEGMMNPGKLVN